ncbi:MAG: hypothetical protein E7661_08485 [Ruminococcaceae bacterium]|nr:hypothetical protein [Oscillospiraceae bacterium]
MKIRPIKIAVHSFLFHLLYTAISWLFFSFFMAGTHNQMIVDEMFSTLRWSMFGFSLVTFLIYEFIIAYAYFKNTSRKREYLAYTEGGVTDERAAEIRKLSLKEALLMTLPALLVQLPIALFYTGFGYGYANALGFERFFIGWIGFYQPWGNAFLGMLINLGPVFLFSLAARILSHGRWEKNRIRK